MAKFYIHTLADLIGGKHISQQTPDGHWVRAVPVPYYGGSLLAAWEVLRGRAFAVRWPKGGELEKALEGYKE